MDYTALEKYDPSQMHKVYDKWPDQARTAFESDIEPVCTSDIDHVVFTGMGGSGAIGDMFSAIFSKSNIHVSLVKGYLLPKTVDERTLVIATSMSGNTDETLTVLEFASRLDCDVVAFSSGGKVESFCQQNKIGFYKVPMVHSPRASYPSFVYSVLKALGSILPIGREGILESISSLESLQKQVGTGNLADSNPALQLSKWLSGIPLVYFPSGLTAAAIRFKNSLQENAKTHVIIEDVIEACHNGIMSWERPSSVRPILLQGQDDYVKTKQRWKVLKEYFDHRQISYWEVFSVDGNVLSKIICLIYLLDFSSIYYSVANRIDPTPVDSIDYIKERL